MGKRGSRVASDGLKLAPDRGDPFAAVVHLGRRATRTGLIIGFFVAVLTHGAFAGRAFAAPVQMRIWAEHAQKSIHDHLWAHYDVEVVKPPPVLPEPKEEVQQEESEESKPAPPPAPREPAASEPPPAAARAGQVLTAPEQPDEALNLTDDGFVVGDGNNYVGGITAPAGTGTAATYNPAASPTGKVGGTGTSKAPPPPQPLGPDRSRSATISVGTNWSSCPFPAEADVDQVDYGVVTLLVTVRPDGTPRSVKVLSDPGHGFGRAARLCALSKRYAPALDREGKAIVGTTPPIRVTFTR